jgi:hypothetical protein
MPPKEGRPRRRSARCFSTWTIPFCDTIGCRPQRVRTALAHVCSRLGRTDLDLDALVADIVDPREALPSPHRFDALPVTVVEVLSPTNWPGERWRRIGDLLDAGTRLVWLIDPERRTALVIHPGGDVRTLGEDGALDGEDGLPGFALPLRDVLV